MASKQADEQKKLIIEQEVQKRQFQKIEELKADMQIDGFVSHCFSLLYLNLVSKTAKNRYTLNLCL
ncbi:hypothetical protein BTM471_05610 [Helicobacter pylori]